jgi:hypothetical protein
VIRPDWEIFEVEQRLATRRAQLARHSREASERALQALASPLALAAVAAVGFFAARWVVRRRERPPHPERRKSDHGGAAKRTGLAGMLLPAAMWFVRLKWGSPVRAAQALLENFGKKKVRASPPGDMSRP